MDRAAELAAWCRAFLPAWAAGEPDCTLIPLPGDAGFRRYFRLATRPSLIAVLAPPERAELAAFVAKGAALAAGGVRVPRLWAVDFRRGFLLLEDLGEEDLLTRLEREEPEPLYDLAEEALQRIQALSPDAGVFPPYDRAALVAELDLFPRWFLGRLLDLRLGEGEARLLGETFALLVREALSQPRVVVHRDFHSRNLLLDAEGRLGVVDYQDAVVGPVTYDLVSLWRDCYIRWPRELVWRRVERFFEGRLGRSAGSGVSGELRRRWFDLMGLQRHLKVLGIFARLWLRDGKPRYLDDLPLVLRYVLEVSGEYPELGPFHRWLLERVVPALPAQPWYRDWQTAGE
ncbi:MAG: cell wall phosphotransferase [Porticoccaceae bacterium]|nr:MAG: cell wall phosphotransferase [Porticoccaceae bacterium]